MTEVLRWRVVFLLGVLLVASAAAENNLGRFFSPRLLEAGKLEVVWEDKLPIKVGERLKDMYIVGGRIYVLSSHNYMVCFDRENGNVIFSSYVGHSGFPVMGLELYKDELFSIIGNELVEINPQYGTRLSSSRLELRAVCPAARNDSYFYLCGVDGRVHILREEDKVEVFEAAADGDSAITWIIADDDFVVFSTSAGDCISMRAEKPERLWRFGAAGAIAGPIVRDQEWLFLASRDTNVYKLDISTGGVIWKYQTPAKLEQGPRVARKAVYQYALGAGLTAIDKESGGCLWHLPTAVDLLAEADSKSYLMTDDRKLAVMDHNKANLEYTVNFAGVSKYASNVSDSKIYVGSDDGWIVCLKPTK